MPLITFDKVLKIISTILNILSAALAAFGSSWNTPTTSDDVEGHA